MAANKYGGNVLILAANSIGKPLILMRPFH
jgi:hypothetical protein